MMDYANLVEHIKDKYSIAPNSPVITFGGSYGGMLAAWMRMKFPSIISAAVVSGGPILYFKDSSEAPEPVFYEWIGKIYEKMGNLKHDKCGRLITEGLQAI